MKDRIRIISRNALRTDDAKGDWTRRQVAPSADRVRWLAAIVEAFGDKCADWRYDPDGEWAFEVWVANNPTDGLVLPKKGDGNRKSGADVCARCTMPYKRYDVDKLGLCAFCRKDYKREYDRERKRKIARGRPSGTPNKAVTVVCVDCAGKFTAYSRAAKRCAPCRMILNCERVKAAKRRETA